MSTGPYDPMEGNADWGYTGYGSGDPKANGFLDKFGRAMPWIVGGIMTGGALQSAGVIPGGGGAASAAGSASAAGGSLPAGSIPIAYAPGATIPNAAALGTSVAGASGGLSGADWLKKLLGDSAGGGALTDAAGAGSSLLDKILKGAGLGLAGASAVNGFRTPPATGQLNDLIGMSTQRVKDSEPLFKALNAMAMGGMPNYTKGQ